MPTAANAGYYAQIVAERAVLRRLVEAGTKIVQMGYAQGGGDVATGHRCPGEKIAADGTAVLARAVDRDLYILADPDLYSKNPAAFDKAIIKCN